MASSVEPLLVRHQAVSLALLLLLTVTAWVWLAMGAGTGMEPGLAPPALMPPEGASQPAAMAGMEMPLSEPQAQWPVGRFALAFSMWGVMMIAMMLPSAAPVILLHIRAATAVGAPLATGSFAAGYLLVWGVFSLLAAGLQMVLQEAGIMGSMDMASASRPFSAAVLIAAGIYQLSPLKNACLRQCRNPAQFLARYYVPGSLGALCMGMIHGAFCTGCCWMLMALLFVGGVMNLAWVAFLAALVAAEKLLPGGRRVALLSGVMCLLWGAWVAFS